jgi:hypothetical protein
VAVVLAYWFTLGGLVRTKVGSCDPPVAPSAVTNSINRILAYSYTYMVRLNKL